MMKPVSQLLCVLAPIFPLYMLMEQGSFTNPLLILIGLLFVVFHLFPFIYLYLRIPGQRATLGLQLYWLIAIAAAAGFGNYVYFDWMMAKQAPDYRPDAQEAIIFAVIPMYQIAIAFGACYLRRLLSPRMKTFEEEPPSCKLLARPDQ